MTRRCNGCGDDLPISEFTANKKMLLGRSYRCKRCHREYMRRYRKEHPDRVASAQARYRERHRDKVKESYSRYREKERERVLASRLSWNSNNTEKRRAHHQVEMAVKAGRVERPSGCEECGEVTSVHGHHEDYGKPLDVEWLCPGCHSRRHAAEGTERRLADDG